MSAPFTPPATSSARPRLLHRIFGAVPDAAVPPTPPVSADRAAFDAAHGATIDAFCDALAQAGLAPTPDTLMLAWAMGSGLGHAASTAIDAARNAAGHIPAAMVPTLLIALGLRSDGRRITAMLHQAEADVGTAAAAAGRSSAAIADYHRAIDAPAKAMADPARAPSAIAEMQGLTRTLLDRTLAAESELRATADTMGELREQLIATQRQALADPLTNLPNRRAFDIALNEAISGCATDGRPLSIAFCDIDHFKAVNDTHGHATGDRVIRMIANLLDAMTAQGCHVARHGGEEFAIILAGQNASAAHQRIDSTRVQLGNMTLVNRDTAQPMARISFSAGIAQFHPGDSASTLLARADHALYQAKHLGRDRVCIAPPRAGRT